MLKSVAGAEYRLISPENADEFDYHYARQSPFLMARMSANLPFTKDYEHESRLQLQESKLEQSQFQTGRLPPDWTKTEFLNFFRQK